MALARKKLRPLLFITILLCALGIIVSSISLSARSWYGRTAQISIIQATSIQIEFGLFAGIKTQKIQGEPQNKGKELAVVCEGSLCMFSCGLNGSKRKADIQNLIKTKQGNDYAYCEDSNALKDAHASGKNGTARNANSAPDGFFHFAYWLATIVLAASGVTFSVIGGALALYNTFESPTQPIFGIFGLYIWNGCAAASSLLAMIVYGSCYGSELKDNGAISETISKHDTYTGSGSLGYCYWILILPVLFNLSNLGILYFHSWKLAQSDKQITHVIDDKLRNGDILLF